jgi:hypothetical protein
MNETIKSLQAGENRRSSRIFEILLAFLGGINCVLVPLVFFAQGLTLSPPGANPWLEQWPFPALYFLEILALGLATAYFIVTNRGASPSRWNGLPWISAGILLTFVILGAFSIGLYLIPAMLSFLGAGILGDRRQAGNWPTHVIYFMFAAMAQAVAAFLLILIFR